MLYVSRATANGYSTLKTNNNFTVIHCGLDENVIPEKKSGRSREECRRKLNVAPGDTVFLLVGTVCDRKGQHDFVRAIGMMQDVGVDWKAFILSDRPSSYSEEMHRMIGELPSRARARITVMPNIPDITPYWLAADVFVCTSRIESYPRVILEAMAFGLPIVSKPGFGISEQIREGINALTYHPGVCERLAVLLKV